MRKLLIAMMALGLAVPAVTAEDAPKEDQAIKQIDEMIASADVNKDDAQWRTKLSKPEPATFDASRSYYANMTTNKGPVRIKLLPDVAPMHVTSLIYLTRMGFYDGLAFHRVIPGFMAQTGDPTGTGRGGSGKNLKAEFSRSARFERGTVGMARSQSPNSADSQFFIMFKPAPHLNGAYTVWGQVIEGMEFVDKLARGQPPANPDRIIRMRPAAAKQ